LKINGFGTPTPKWIERGEAAWRAEQPYWGIWATPESELALIPCDLAGRSVVELGCNRLCLALV